MRDHEHRNRPRQSGIQRSIAQSFHPTTTPQATHPRTTIPCTTSRHNTSTTQSFRGLQTIHQQVYLNTTKPSPKRHPTSNNIPKHTKHRGSSSQRRLSTILHSQLRPIYSMRQRYQRSNPYTTLFPTTTNLSHHRLHKYTNHPLTTRHHRTPSHIHRHHQQRHPILSPTTNSKHKRNSTNTNTSQTTNNKPKRSRLLSRRTLSHIKTHLISPSPTTISSINNILCIQVSTRHNPRRPIIRPPNPSSQPITTQNL